MMVLEDELKTPIIVDKDFWETTYGLSLPNITDKVSE